MLWLQYSNISQQTIGDSLLSVQGCQSLATAVPDDVIYEKSVTDMEAANKEVSGYFYIIKHGVTSFRYLIFVCSFLDYLLSNFQRNIIR